MRMRHIVVLIGAVGLALVASQARRQPCAELRADARFQNGLASAPAAAGRTCKGPIYNAIHDLHRLCKSQRATQSLIYALLRLEDLLAAEPTGGPLTDALLVLVETPQTDRALRSMSAIMLSISDATGVRERLAKRMLFDHDEARLVMGLAAVLSPARAQRNHADRIRFWRSVLTSELASVMPLTCALPHVEYEPVAIDLLGRATIVESREARFYRGEIVPASSPELISVFLQFIRSGDSSEPACHRVMEWIDSSIDEHVAWDSVALDDNLPLGVRVEALRRYRPTDPVSEMDTLAAVWTAATHSDVRRELVRRIGRLNGLEPGRIVSSMMTCWAVDRNETVRAEILQALGALTSPEALHGLALCAQGAETEDQFRTAILLLSTDHLSVEGARVRDDLLQACIQSADPQRREFILRCRARLDSTSGESPHPRQ